MGHSLKVWFTMVIKAWQQEHEPAGHMAFMVKKQAETDASAQLIYVIHDASPYTDAGPIQSRSSLLS